MQPRGEVGPDRASPRAHQDGVHLRGGLGHGRGEGTAAGATTRSQFLVHLDVFQPFWIFLLHIYPFSLFMLGPTHPPKTQPQALHHPHPPARPTSKRLGPQCGCGEHPLAPSQPSLLLRQLFISHSHPGCSLFLTLILLQARMLSTLSCSSSRTWPPSTRQSPSSTEQIRTKRYPHSPKKDLSVRNTRYVTGEPGH